MQELIRHKRGFLLFGLNLSFGLTMAQVPVSFDSIAGISWDSLTIDRAKTLFQDTARIVEGPPGHAYLLGGGCMPIPGNSYVKFQRAGVVFVFSPPDSTDAQKLLSMVVSQKGAVVTPRGIDVGDEITPPSNSYGSGCMVVRRFGEEYLEIFDRGVFYYCLPASLRRAEKGKSVKVSKIGVRENYGP